MKILSKLFLFLAMTCTLIAGSYAQTTQEKIAAAMEMDHRTEADLKRDANRDPLQALAFMGFKDDMTVVEYFPAGGAWYTKILAPVLAEKGELYVIDSAATFTRWGELLNNEAFKTVKKVEITAQYNRAEGRYEIGDIKLKDNNADLFLNIREYHNLNAEDKARVNKVAYDSLKPGGTYVIIDHTRRHMQPESRILGRREDPVQVIIEAQAAGFVLEKSSDMFFREADALDLEVGNAAVTGQTDRFFLVFKKPE
ncbi:class I SAM-dependent methyltransferase [Aurantivibrio infirmus]